MEMLSMDGYGLYVWTSFGLTLAVFVINEWRARALHKRVYREIEVRVKALEDRQ